MSRASQRFRVFYHKLFVSYWCAARRYQDEGMSVFYGVLLVSLNWILIGSILLFMGMDVLQHISSRTIDPGQYWMLVIWGVPVLGNLVYFFRRSRWRAFVGEYADLDEQGRYIPHMKKRMAYLIAIVLWLMTITVASI